MIARLTGTVDAVAADSAVIDVGGVGYLVFCSRRTLDRLDRLDRGGTAVSVLVDTHVREDHIHLYGFLDAAERDWFRLLTTVQGVGGRMALAILGVLAPDALATAIAAQDRTPLTRADGVGPKIASRIVAELKDKAGAYAFASGAAAVTGSAAGVPAAPAGEASAPADAVSALVNLGYQRAEAFAAVHAAAKRLGAEAGVERLIPAALRELGQG